MTMASRIAPLSCASLLAFSIAACGDDDSEVDDDVSSDSTTTDADDDGASSTGATLTDPTADTSDASSGMASTTTAAATDTTAGTDDSTGAPTIDPRVADCLRIAACEADGGTPIGVQACLAHALDVPWTWASTGTQRLDVDAMSCKLAAADCDTVRACTPAIDDYAKLCSENAGTDLCDGDTWVFCDFEGAPIAAMDCAAAGLACNRDIWAGCGTEACEFGVTEPACDGDVLVQCAPSGFLQEIDCATQYNYVHVNGKEGEEVYSIAGQTCGFDSMMSALGCVGTGEPCGFFEQSCEGDVLQTCAGGSLSGRDCSSLDPAGQSCGFWQSGPFAGAATCGYVDPPCELDADETCTDGRIDYCEYDHTASVDCIAEGWSGCTTADLDGRTIAYCTP